MAESSNTILIGVAIGAFAVLTLAVGARIRFNRSLQVPRPNGVAFINPIYNASASPAIDASPACGAAAGDDGYQELPVAAAEEALYDDVPLYSDVHHMALRRSANCGTMDALVLQHNQYSEIKCNGEYLDVAAQGLHVSGKNEGALHHIDDDTPCPEYNSLDLEYDVSDGVSSVADVSDGVSSSVAAISACC